MGVLMSWRTPSPVPRARQVIHRCRMVYLVAKSSLNCVAFYGHSPTSFRRGYNSLLATATYSR